MAHLTQLDVINVTLIQHMSEVWGFYKRKRRADGIAAWVQKGSTVWNTLPILGSSDRPILSAKAGETDGLMECAIEMLERHYEHMITISAEVHLEARFVVEARRAAQRFNAVIK
ncbi:hypothetical protein N9L19_01105 [bacterium]|nr:hypothetical protein [bacterium]